MTTRLVPASAAPGSVRTSPAADRPHPATLGVLASPEERGTSDGCRPGVVRPGTWAVPAPGQPKRSTILRAPPGTWSLPVVRATRIRHDLVVAGQVAAALGGAGGAGADGDGAAAGPDRAGARQAARATRRPACEVGESPCAAPSFRLTSDPYI
jgi:hypothetical protein